MRRIYLFTVMVLVTIISHAQKREVVSGPYSGSSETYDNLNLGIGFGFDYGGIGGNLTYYPQKNIGVFFGGGYVIAGFGYNAGLKFRFLPKHGNITPFLMAMYGYNAAIHVSGSSELDKIFYGPTVGAGCDFGSHIVGKGVFSLAIFVPIRNSEPDDYMNYLQDNGVTFKNKLIPIGFSVGYKWNLH